MFIDWLCEDVVGLSTCVGERGTVKNVGVANTDVTGGTTVGGLVGGDNSCSIGDCYSAANLSGNSSVGVLWWD